MPRTILRKAFEIYCECDRCGRPHSRTSDGDIGLPQGWSFLYVSIYDNQQEGALLCPSCVAIVLTAAAPAQLERKS